MKLIKKEHSRYYRALYIGSIINLAGNALVLILRLTQFSMVRRMQMDLGAEPIDMMRTVVPWVLTQIALALFFLARYLKRKSKAMMEERE